MTNQEREIVKQLVRVEEHLRDALNAYPEHRDTIKEQLSLCLSMVTDELNRILGCRQAF